MYIYNTLLQERRKLIWAGLGDLNLISVMLVGRWCALCGAPTDSDDHLYGWDDGLRWRFRSSYCNYLSYEALYRKLSGILKLPPRSFLLNNLYNFVECFITEIIVITYRSHDIIVTWNSGEFNPSPRQAYQYIYSYRYLPFGKNEYYAIKMALNNSDYTL